MSSTTPLKIHGTFASQPCRAVVWLCELNSIPYELSPMNPSWPRKDPRKIKFIEEMNPSGRVPCLEDINSNVILYESGAILTYISTKYNLQDYYPNGTQSESSLKRRALIDQMLHWHHENIRLVTIGYIAPLLRADIPLEKWMKISGQIINQRKLLKYSLKILDTRHLNNNKYIVDNNVSVADLLAYEEIYQLKKFNDLFPYNNFKQLYPNIDLWLERMSKLPKHDKVHRILNKLEGFIQKRVKETQPLQKLIASKL